MGPSQLERLVFEPSCPKNRVDEAASLGSGIDLGSHPVVGPTPSPRSTKQVRIRRYTGERHLCEYPRLSKPVELMRGSYDVVVIGSGYGGGVAAARMSRARQSVCVLERGKERWPGEYPSRTVDAMRELHVSGKFAPGWLDGQLVNGGSQTGMYHLVFGKGQNAVVGNGLGGTSLINANVFMPADKGTLSMTEWPPEIRDRADELHRYYQKVKEVLQPVAYPQDWPRLPKLDLLEKQAKHLGLGANFRRVLQTTRFHNGPNSCGVEMSASQLTGQDTTGLNDGSKTTTLVTYLADAWNWGAELFCECEVRRIDKAKDSQGRDKDGYLVYFAWHGRNRGHFSANLHGDLMWVHARKAVFLGAGAIGTTEILLRSKAMGLQTSAQTGQQMSGNGDMLAFAYNTDERASAIGRAVPSPQVPVGPTITGVIDCRDGHENPLDGFVLEDGAVPHALARLLQAMVELMPGHVTPPARSLREQAQAALARYGSRFLGPFFRSGALQRTQVYLVMSHDSNQATLTLEDDKPVLEFLGVGRSDHVKHLNHVLAQATEAVGGTLVPSPFFAAMGEQQVTVHPIGGAPMARDGTGTTGVVNHAGEVFKGTGSETWDGLIVTDASVIPTALGTNPFATVAALAERSVEHYAQCKGLHISEQRNGVLDLFGRPEHPMAHASDPSDAADEVESMAYATGIMTTADSMRASGFAFTEVMSGYVHYDPSTTLDRRATYDLAYRTAESLCEKARFFLSAHAFDARSIVDGPQHRAMLTGTLVYPAVQGSPFMVQRGNLDLFIVDHRTPGTHNLTYDFEMRGINGQKYHFHGYKAVDSSVALAPMQLWKSTSTLYVTISEGELSPHLVHTSSGTSTSSSSTSSNRNSNRNSNNAVAAQDLWRLRKPLAKGIMHIQPRDFATEMMTLTPTGSSLLQKARSSARFLTFFTRKSLALLLAPLAPLQYPSQNYSGYVNDTPPCRSISIRASDGVFTRLHVWEPTACPDDDDSNIRNLFMIPGASVDHQIFALPTIPFNAVNYFCRAGYRVFVSVHRIGLLMVAENDWTTFDARLDLRACLEHIRNHYPGPGDNKVYTVAHCMGSVAFASGLLDGTIPARWILGVTCSQVFMHPIWQTLNRFKATAPPVSLDRIYGLLGGRWFACQARPHDSLLQRTVNQLLRLYPDQRSELCNSASCHRISLVFGRCWNHRNLNEATHRQIDRFFGGVNMRMEGLLMRMGVDGHVLGNGPFRKRLTVRENVARLRGVPVMLWVGRDNAVLSPEATERSYETLCDMFGREAGVGDGRLAYRRMVVPGYGHLDGWMGRNAWRDVFPMVREEVDRVVRGEGYRFIEPNDRWKRMIEDGDLMH